MAGIIKRLRIELEDRLRYGPAVRSAMAGYCLLADHLRGAPDDQARARHVVRLCGAARLAPDGKILERIEKRILRHVDTLDAARLDWADFLPRVNDGRITKGAIIKPWVGPREKGVVFVSFEDQWARLLACSNLRAFAERYWLVVAPTWCPPHSLVNAAFPAAYPGPIFTLISNLKDLEIFPRLSRRNVVVPLFASSWVNPAHYRPYPRDRREIDMLMVANFGKYKRHFALFRAMREMPRDVRVTLVGQPQDGRDANAIYAEAALYGVRERVTVHSSVTNEFLADALCRAKVSVIMSRREGSCVVVAESMFADTPVGLLDSAAVGSRAFVNEATGTLLRQSDLAEDLCAFVASARRYSPREWALRNISCHRSSEVLNDTLRTHALVNGQEWTRDITPLCWRPDPLVIGRAEELTWVGPECDYVSREFGVDIPTGTLRIGADEPSLGAPRAGEPVGESPLMPATAV
jgi:glycosyltransferase involved in cell wall biosynthesis